MRKHMYLKPDDEDNSLIFRKKKNCESFCVKSLDQRKDGSKIFDSLKNNCKKNLKEISKFDYKNSPDIQMKSKQGNVNQCEIKNISENENNPTNTNNCSDINSIYEKKDYKNDNVDKFVEIFNVDNVDKNDNIIKFHEKYDTEQVFYIKEDKKDITKAINLLIHSDNRKDNLGGYINRYDPIKHTKNTPNYIVLENNLETKENDSYVNDAYKDTRKLPRYANLYSENKVFIQSEDGIDNADATKCVVILDTSGGRSEICPYIMGDRYGNQNVYENGNVCLIDNNKKGGEIVCTPTQNRNSNGNLGGKIKFDDKINIDGNKDTLDRSDLHDTNESYVSFNTDNKCVSNKLDDNSDEIEVKNIDDGYTKEKRLNSNFEKFDKSSESLTFDVSDSILCNVENLENATKNEKKNFQMCLDDKNTDNIDLKHDNLTINSNFLSLDDNNIMDKQQYEFDRIEPSDNLINDLNTPPTPSYEYNELPDEFISESNLPSFCCDYNELEISSNNYADNNKIDNNSCDNNNNTNGKDFVMFSYQNEKKGLEHLLADKNNIPAFLPIKNYSSEENNLLDSDNDYIFKKKDILDGKERVIDKKNIFEMDTTNNNQYGNYNTNSVVDNIMKKDDILFDVLQKPNINKIDSNVGSNLNTTFDNMRNNRVIMNTKENNNSAIISTSNSNSIDHGTIANKNINNTIDDNHFYTDNANNNNINTNGSRITASTSEAKHILPETQNLLYKLNDVAQNVDFDSPATKRYKLSDKAFMDSSENKMMNSHNRLKYDIMPNISHTSKIRDDSNIDSRVVQHDSAKNISLYSPIIPVSNDLPKYHIFDDVDKFKEAADDVYSNSGVVNNDAYIKDISYRPCSINLLNAKRYNENDNQDACINNNSTRTDSTHEFNAIEITKKTNYAIKNTDGSLETFKNIKKETKIVDAEVLEEVVDEYKKLIKNGRTDELFTEKCLSIEKYDNNSNNTENIDNNNNNNKIIDDNIENSNNHVLFNATNTHDNKKYSKFDVNTSNEKNIPFSHYNYIDNKTEEDIERFFDQDFDEETMSVNFSTPVNEFSNEEIGKINNVFIEEVEENFENDRILGNDGINNTNNLTIEESANNSTKDDSYNVIDNILEEVDDSNNNTKDINNNKPTDNIIKVVDDDNCSKDDNNINVIDNNIDNNNKCSTNYIDDIIGEMFDDNSIYSDYNNEEVNNEYSKKINDKSTNNNRNQEIPYEKNVNKNILSHILIVNSSDLPTEIKEASEYIKNKKNLYIINDQNSQSNNVNLNSSQSKNLNSINAHTNTSNYNEVRNEINDKNMNTEQKILFFNNLDDSKKQIEQKVKIQNQKKKFSNALSKNSPLKLSQKKKAKQAQKSTQKPKKDNPPSIKGMATKKKTIASMKNKKTGKETKKDVKVEEIQKSSALPEKKVSKPKVNTKKIVNKEIPKESKKTLKKPAPPSKNLKRKSASREDLEENENKNKKKFKKSIENTEQNTKSVKEKDEDTEVVKENSKNKGKARVISKSKKTPENKVEIRIKNTGKTETEIKSKTSAKNSINQENGIKTKSSAKNSIKKENKIKKSGAKNSIKKEIENNEKVNTKSSIKKDSGSKKSIKKETKKKTPEKLLSTKKKAKPVKRKK
ncbi:hypothetical protein EDEG_01521 [Edhazardia aedis USNM 41457]|uniref:Uncharacterized protein n=1 Tax=Edhazardia aedis (strain USNM 41457) TaxID=1003232 RepID=J9D9L2_EDHAE|nr:hypothetical protein EDEG_01521 [Edhazardia aedis USNM 41457]|eukprot:EJW04189.1 hypothetical protein EDEG_01521 [Edhazardia aedis USNM 41457]